MIQISILFVSNQGEANDKLRLFQRDNPKREIIGVSMAPAEPPAGWFMTITYRVNI